MLTTVFQDIYIKSLSAARSSKTTMFDIKLGQRAESWIEWIDELLQFVANESLPLLSECVQKVFSSLELIEDGLKKYLQYDKSVFSSSGREDVDVRMLGLGRPFVFRIVNPFDTSTYNQETLNKIQKFVNLEHGEKLKVRDLQLVTKADISKNLKDGEESKTKNYRALCCCSRKLTQEDLVNISSIKELYIDQKTPIRVLHRRPLKVRRRQILQMQVEHAKIEDFDSLSADDLDNVFVLHLLTEAGTYIKEFVHGDFGRTVPSIATLLGDCETDLMELDVMEVNLDWPPKLDDISEEEILTQIISDDNMEPRSDMSLNELYNKGLNVMKEAESTPRGSVRQDKYIEARKLFTEAQNMVESLSLFSDNESVDDIATGHLKYLLIPAYLAKIALSEECITDRLSKLERADAEIRNFFLRILKYKLGNETHIRKALEFSYEDIVNDGRIGARDTSLEFAMQSRTEKIENFKKMKILENHIQQLFEKLDHPNEGDVIDEEMARDYYSSLLKKWINDTLESLENEVRPAIHFERSRSTLESNASPAKRSQPVKPDQHSSKNGSKTITLVKDDLQKQVFGLGYPSHHTVTVDEFIGKKISDGELAFQKHKEVYGNSLQRYAENPTLRQDQEDLSDCEREEKEDRHDPKELERRRRWDEFKDENPRGSGNRHNMG